MANNNVNVSGGISLTGAVFIVFLVLKLIGTIDWSWWWVTAPLWGPIALCLAIAIIAFAILILLKIIGAVLGIR